MTQVRAAQIPLTFAEGRSPDFDLYVPGANVEAHCCMRALRVGGPFSNICLWGAAGTGKTHLLGAACQLFRTQGQGGAYLGLSRLGELSPAVLDTLGPMDLVCLDDIHFLAGHPEWELALFQLYNLRRDAGRPLVLGSRINPAALAVELPDLASRLSWGVVFHLKALDDDAKLTALRKRADARGFELPAEVADYLMQRFPRDMAGLCTLLDRLDYASLAMQRRLTIPLVKSMCDG